MLLSLASCSMHSFSTHSSSYGYDGTHQSCYECIRWDISFCLSVCVFAVLSVYPVSVCLCFQTFQLMFFRLFPPEWWIYLLISEMPLNHLLFYNYVIDFINDYSLIIHFSDKNCLIFIRLINFMVFQVIIFLYLWIRVLSKLFSSSLDMWVFVEGIIWRSFCTFDSTFSYCIDSNIWHEWWMWIPFIFETVSRFPDTHYYLIK